MKRARPDGRLAALLALVALAAALVYGLVERTDRVLVALLALGAAFGLVAWWIAARARQQTAEALELEHAAEEAEEQKREAELVLEKDAAERQASELLRELRRTEERYDDELSRERHERARLLRLREREIDWLHELRQQVMRAHKEIGTLGDPDDLYSLVLRTAMSLVGAEKGMLLSRTDENDDGDLDVAASAGFENDPTHSAVAQRFASMVIDRNETVREDHVHDRETAADEEIENLVAIPIYVADRFSGVVVAANKPGGFDEHEDPVLLSLGDSAGAILHSTKLEGALRNAYITTVAMLADAIEMKDPFLHGHSHDVSRHVVAVAKSLGLGARRSEELGFAALLHDVGKIAISERILLKPAALTDEERAVMEQHPRIGYRLLERVPVMHDVAIAVLHHHERWDGEGYPSRLTGEQIPIEARIVAVADAFSAMTTDRPYKERMSMADACEELKRCAGEQFDPEVVRLFTEEVSRGRGKRVPALDLSGDPELEALRSEGEPLLGFGSFRATDNLTLLRSHRHFHDLVHAECERATLQGSGFGVILVELTKLAEVNSADGFDAGDDLLRQAARCVEKVAAACGGTACRYSGRRFALVVPAPDAATAERIGDEVSEELGEIDARVTIAGWKPGDGHADVMARLDGERATVS
jgi:diguanylate cyclase (GGDEF)-like protein